MPLQSSEHYGAGVGNVEGKQTLFGDAAADLQSRQWFGSLTDYGSGCLLDSHLGELLKVWGASGKKRRESMSWSTTEGRETAWLGKNHHL